MSGAAVRVARTLGELHVCLKGEAPWPEPPDPPRAVFGAPDGDEPLDLADVRGLEGARRALAVAAAGAHHLLMVGPPGVGKTMLARRLPTILPPLAHDEALEVTKIHSAAGVHRGPALRTDPPFRQPHHSASMVSLVGGGSSPRAPRRGQPCPPRRVVPRRAARVPRPRARGVAPAARRARRTRASRAAGTIEFPADFLLVACANPCPCGREPTACKCGDVQTTRYARRLSAPLLDRFDLRIRVEKAGKEPGESSAVVAARVAGAVERQQARLRGTPWRRNAHIPAGALERYTALDDAARDMWHEQCDVRQLTGRGAARIRRVARTLADLADRSVIDADDVTRASLMREDLW